MVFVFFLLFFVFAVALIVGMIKPSLVVRWGQKRTRMRAFLIYIWLMVFSLVGLTASVDTPEKTLSSEPLTTTAQSAQPMPAQASAEQQAAASAVGTATTPPMAKYFAEAESAAHTEPAAPTPAEMRAKQQAVVTKFQIDLAWLASSTDKDLGDVVAVVQAAQRGLVSDTDTLRAAQHGAAICDQASREASRLTVPQGLPEKAEKACREAKGTLEDAFYHGSEAFGAMQNFLDDHKTSSMKEYEDEWQRFAALKMLSLATLDTARPAVGLPSTPALMASPEYKAWQAYQEEYSRVFEEAQRKFGVQPHLAIKPGTKLKLERSVFVVPGYDTCRQANVPDVQFITQAVTLQPGQELIIWARPHGSEGNPKCYIVKFNDGQATLVGAVNPVQLMWYDTPERLKAHHVERQAYVEPKYRELAQKHYGSQGLDQNAIDLRAINEQWMDLWRYYGQGS